MTALNAKMAPRNSGARGSTTNGATTAAPLIRAIRCQNLNRSDVSPFPFGVGIRDFVERNLSSKTVSDQLASRSLTYSGSDGPVISIGFADMSQLGLWTKPGAGFICIEPWQGTADLAGYEGDIRDKPGIVEIAAGGKRDFTMSVTVSRGGIA